MFVRSFAIVVALLATAVPALAVPHPGDRAPAIALTDTGGKAITMSSLAGRPVYLNFFATWCGPCRAETPSIVALSKKYRGVSVIGVDVGENAGKALGFAHDFNVPYTLVTDPDTTTRATYGGGLYFPLHVFIDRHGVVRMYHPGEMTSDQIAAALAAVSR